MQKSRTRTEILCRELLRHKVNPNPRGRYRDRAGRVTHQTERWEHALVNNLDTERALSKLSVDGRFVLLLVCGGGYSITEAAFMLMTTERVIRGLLRESEAAFERILDQAESES